MHVQSFTLELTLLSLQDFPRLHGKAYDTTVVCKWLHDVLRSEPVNENHAPWSVFAILTTVGQRGFHFVVARLLGCRGGDYCSHALGAGLYPVLVLKDQGPLDCEASG